MKTRWYLPECVKHPDIEWSRSSEPFRLHVNSFVRQLVEQLDSRSSNSFPNGIVQVWVLSYRQAVDAYMRLVLALRMTCDDDILLQQRIEEYDV